MVVIGRSRLDIFPPSPHPWYFCNREQLQLRHQTLQTLHFCLSRLSQFEPLTQIDKAGSRYDQMLPKAHRFHSPDMLTRRWMYKTDVIRST